MMRTVGTSLLLGALHFAQQPLQTAAFSTRITDSISGLHENHFSARAENETLCGSGKPPSDALQYGIVSFPTTTDLDNSAFMDWNVRINVETPEKPIFYFTNPLQYTDNFPNRTDGPNGCSFTPSPSASGLPMSTGHSRLSRKRQAGSMPAVNASSLLCPQSLFFTCADELQSLSLQLRNTTITSIGSSIGLVCQIQRSNGDTLGISDCGLVEDAADPAPATYDPYTYDHALVLGPVLGGLGLVLAIAIVVYIVRRRRRRTRRIRALAVVDDMDQDSDESITGTKARVAGSGPLTSGARRDSGNAFSNREVKMQSLGSLQPPERARGGGRQRAASGDEGVGEDARQYSPISNPSEIVSYNSQSKLIAAREKGNTKGSIIS